MHENPDSSSTVQATGTRMRHELRGTRDEFVTRLGRALGFQQYDVNDEYIVVHDAERRIVIRFHSNDDRPHADRPDDESEHFATIDFEGYDSRETDELQALLARFLF